MTAQTSCRGFSLIEVLVCIGVIAILTSLLIPATLGARSRAAEAQCAGHLRALAVASQLYWDDSADRPFPYLLDRNKEGATYWFGWIGSGAEGARPYDPSLGPLAPYLGRGPLPGCPSWLRYANKAKRKTTSRDFGFGYNRHLPEDTPNLHTLNPSRRVLFGDSAQVNDFQFPASPTNPMLEAFYYISSDPWDYPNAHFRHDGRANVVFADGHIEGAQMEAGSRDERSPRWNVGRLRAELLRPPKPGTDSETPFGVGRVGQ